MRLVISSLNVTHHSIKQRYSPRIAQEISFEILDGIKNMPAQGKLNSLFARPGRGLIRGSKPKVDEKNRDIKMIWRREIPGSNILSQDLALLRSVTMIRRPFSHTQKLPDPLIGSYGDYR